MEGARSQRLSFAPSVVALGTILVVALFVFTTYMEDFDLQQQQVQQYYGYFLDIQIMVFIGFGFLMTFLRRFSYSAVALNFFASCIVWLFALLWMGAAQQVFWNQKLSKIQLDIPLLINASFCAASTMISFGAVIGKTTPTQLVWLLVLEVPLYAVNAHLVYDVFKAVDIGGSISIHVFGAYYGLAASLLVSRKQKNYGMDNPKNSGSYFNDVTAMIGTIFLWIYWPSFNGALASLPIGTKVDEATAYEKQAQFLCIINTVLSLCGCCVAAFGTSALVGGRFNMIHIQNATIAGGVAIGSAAALRLTPGGAVLVGMSAGVISTLGFQYLSPFLEQKLKLGDTCGVHNLHGIPGVFAGLVAGFAAFGQSESFLAHNPNTQIVYQIYSLLVTLGIAIGGGLLMGFIVSTLNFTKSPELASDEFFDDSPFWFHVPVEVLPVPGPSPCSSDHCTWDVAKAEALHAVGRPSDTSTISRSLPSSTVPANAPVPEVRLVMPIRAQP